MNKKDLKMRPVGNEYLEQYNALLRYVFQVTDQELSSVGWQEKEIIRAKFPTMQKADVIGWFDGDTLVSQVAVYPMRVKVFGKTYSMGGLTGVGTYPEYSNMGLMHKLLEQALKNMGLSEEEIERMLKERMQEQNEEHNGGSYWVGTHGMSTFGNSGLAPKGIRVGGESMYHRAFRVAGERKFRDFRRDNTLDTRQFQVALRRLRQFSGLVDLPATEFDVDNTIKDTANNAGSLKVRYKKPRQNTVKVLLLMDSGGSMDYYSQLCSSLFQAVSKSGHFKDLKVYYFHNCVYSRLYTEPTLRPSNTVPTDWVLSNLSSEYKVILVGDAQMAPHELVTQFRYRTPDGEEHKRCGLEWLQMLKGKYPHIVWLNPGDRPTWGEYWTRTYDTIGREFPMFPLTVEGLEEAMKKLLVR